MKPLISISNSMKVIAVSLTGLVLLATLAWSVIESVVADEKRSTHSRMKKQAEGAAGEPKIENVVLEEKRPRFLEAEACAVCHSNSRRAEAMRDNKDRPIAPYDLWQTSMMASSSRDPYWRAVLSAEVVATPSKKALLEEKCTRCHAPMAAPAPMSEAGSVLSYLKAEDHRANLGLDGVSCTVCHQITDKGLGKPESFTGHFHLNTEGKIYGPHADPFPMPMRHHTGYEPTQSTHIMKSALCATCHTVKTNSVDRHGKSTAQGEFHEQTPYLEWRNSIFNDEIKNPSKQARSCQSCHMPQHDEDGQQIKTMIAHNPGGRDFPFLPDRSPYGRHTMVGANAFMTRILRDNAEALGITAPAAAFNASLKQIETMLRHKTGDIVIQRTIHKNDQLEITVNVHNRAGHKLPTAYPSRRVWVKLTVKNKSGQILFASGNYNDEGELVNLKGDTLDSEHYAGPVNPHRDVITHSSQAQVYETIMGDANNNPTFTLLRGATYVKDNRLLPRGWKNDHPDAKATRPYGIGNDPNFSPGTDQITYRIPLKKQGRYTIEAELLYQTITPRHANELFQYDTPEVAAFGKMYYNANRKPELISRTLKQFKMK